MSLCHITVVVTDSNDTDTDSTLVVRTLVLNGQGPTRGTYVPATATQPADSHRNHPDSAERNTDTGDET